MSTYWLPHSYVIHRQMKDLLFISSRDPNPSLTGKKNNYTFEKYVENHSIQIFIEMLNKIQETKKNPIRKKDNIEFVISNNWEGVTYPSSFSCNQFFVKCKQFSIEFKTLYLFSNVRKIWIQLKFLFECVVKDKEKGRKKTSIKISYIQFEFKFIHIFPR